MTLSGKGLAFALVAGTACSVAGVFVTRALIDWAAGGSAHTFFFTFFSSLFLLRSGRHAKGAGRGLPCCQPHVSLARARGPPPEAPSSPIRAYRVPMSPGRGYRRYCE